MQRIGILTAGGDTPALNSTILGAVRYANSARVEVVGLLNGFSAFFQERAPHVILNPLYQEIPQLDATRGGTILGSSRTYVNDEKPGLLDSIHKRIKRLRLDGLICIGGDGTLNGLQPICDMIPTVLAPKTIDNDLGLNYAGEADQWIKKTVGDELVYEKKDHPTGLDENFDIQKMINYATPGYATAVYEAAEGVRRVRTTAESHQRVAIIEVMGRHSGYIALGSSYGQPDMVLVPEHPFNLEHVARRVKKIYEHQRHAVIVCGEGIIGDDGRAYGASHGSTDPSGNIVLSGAAENLSAALLESIGAKFFEQGGNFEDGRAAFFTRKVGHTQRGGRPLRFDRFYAAQLGGNAAKMLLDGSNNAVSTLQWTESDGFTVGTHDASVFRDRYGEIHARTLHPAFYNSEQLQISALGKQYLHPIFENAIGPEDTEFIRQSLFDYGNLYHGYKSVNVDIRKLTRYLDD